MNIPARLLTAFLALAGLVSMAKADPLAISCGPVIRSAVRTTTAVFSFNSELPHVPIPNTAFSVSVPEGSQRCVILTFSASARCPNACFLSAIRTNGSLEPSASNRFAQGTVFRAQSFQFAKRLGAGTHAIHLEINTGNEIENADIGPYTARLVVTE